MKKTFKVLCISFFMACMVFSSFARGQKEESLAKPVTLRIFNAKGENAVEFEKMCADYENQTGVKVEAFSVGSGTSAIDLLRAQMSSKTAPAIYSIRGLTELPEWKESGSVLDFSAVSNPTFQKFANEIPLSMRLSSDGKESFGVPFNVEGYGYMVDSQMLKDLFGNDGNAVLDALRYCSYDEFV
ncbi:MAG TPA: sugar ABC transporter substrate-binding protein, partial [Treponema sp.]|nr:sugar ABC transporter substrate-binding protein [Treponema sp.]